MIKAFHAVIAIDSDLSTALLQSCASKNHKALHLRADSCLQSGLKTHIDGMSTQ